jgi:hypothetical protein
VRLRITRALTGSIDGIQLDRFRPGDVYDVATTLACYLLAIGSAEPVGDDEPASIWPAEHRLFGPHVTGRAFTVPRQQAADRPARKKRRR